MSTLLSSSSYVTIRPFGDGGSCHLIITSPGLLPFVAVMFLSSRLSAVTAILTQNECKWIWIHYRIFYTSIAPRIHTEIYSCSIFVNSASIWDAHIITSKSQKFSPPRTKFQIIPESVLTSEGPFPSKWIHKPTSIKCWTWAIINFTPKPFF